MEKTLKVDYIKKELIVDNVTVGELIDFLADTEDIITDDYKIISNSGKEYYPVYYPNINVFKNDWGVPPFTLTSTSIK